MRLSDYSFHCPACKSRLDTNGVIHLKTERLNGDKGDIFLSTTFGNYGYKHDPDVNFDVGELIEFSCDNCNSLLHSAIKPNFVNMIMRVENKFDFEILFSRKAGIQKTYVVTEDGIESYGRDANLAEVV
jgi:hypothetical protein